MNNNLVTDPYVETELDERTCGETSGAALSRSDKPLVLSNCSQLSDESAKDLYSFGHALYQQDRISEATEAFLYLALYSKTKTDAKNYMALGACNQVRSDFGKAVYFYQISIYLGYPDPAVHLHLGECLLRLTRKSEAAAQFRLVVAATRDSKDRADLFNRASGLLALVEKTGHS